MNQSFFVGIVESRADPLKLGRLQVRVFGVHSESLTDIPTKSLPWAIPLMPATSASLSGIGHSGAQYLEGTMVFLFFQDGDSKQQPIILGSAHGIPLDKNPFSPNYGLVQEDQISLSAGVEQKTTSTVAPTTSGTLVDSAGTPVVDSSGTPISSGETSTELVDISKMVAKYGSNVTLVYNTLKNYGIINPYALVAILSNVAKECAFKPRRESLKYSSVDRLVAIFPSYFKSMSPTEAQTYVGNEEKIANLVYANRYGNGNTASGDGYAYRGGGFIQLTFKANYSDVGSKIGVDLGTTPSKIDDTTVAAKSVSQFFVSKYGGANKVAFSDLDSALISVTKKVNAGGFAHDYPIVVTASKLCVINDEAVVTDTTAQTEAANPSSPENDIKKDATKKEIDSGIVGGTVASRVDTNTGFKDPNNKYPLSSLLKEQDTNRLSRRNVNNTPVQNKLKNRRMGIRTVGGTFNEPPPAYNGQYPYNHTYSTESGHLQEFDDTHGAERVHTYHTAGTFEEIDKYGNKTNKIVGDSFSITERNGYIYIDGTARITIGSDVKLVVGGNLDIEVDGNLNYDVGGNVTWKVGGDLQYGILGQHSIQSGGSTDIDSTTINLNSGTSSSVAPSARSGVSNDYPVQEAENFLGAESLNMDEASEIDVDTYHKKAISEGTVTQKELDSGEEMAKSDKPTDTAPPPPVEILPTSCLAFAGKTDIPDSTQLSSKFTLAMVSTKAIVSKNKVVAQMGLTESQLVCNLKNLAENCLDKIKTKYPNMFVTSAFRPMGTNKTSQHPMGMAADMQFSGVPKTGYYEIAQWIKDNVAFDQLILEYKTTGTGNPWIHVSFNSNGNRKQVLTFMNDKTAATGLKNLG